MHIKNIHCMIEKLAETAKCELDKGIEQIDTKEMGEVAEIIKELSEAEYYAKISKAMDEAEYGEDYDYKGAYEHERKGYRSQPRDSRGRYMSRRGYESRMMPDMDYDEMERMRDYDRGAGKMYYSGTGSSGGSSMGGSSSAGMSGGSSSSGQMGYSESTGGQYSSRMQRDGMGESRYDRAKRSYTETKEMHKGGSSEDKQITMKEAEKMINVIFDEIDEMLEDAPAELKSMIKTKGMTKMQKIN